MRIRLEPNHRQQNIIAAAMRVMGRSPTTPLRRGVVASEAKCAQSLITHYFGAMRAVEFAAIIRGVAEDNAAVMAYAMVNGFTNVLSDDHRRQAADYLASRS